MTPPMSDIEGLVEAGVLKRVETIRELDARYRELQREKLLSIVQRNADTEFGSARGFRDIRSVEEYRQAVAPTTAEDYYDAWDRVAAGERGVLLADPVHAFGLSSGTTGAPKLIPLNKALVRGLKRAIGYTVASHMGRTGNFSLLRGYALQMAACAEVRTTDQGVSVGYVTGIIGAARSYPFHNIGIPPVEVLDLQDWGEKFRVIEERYAAHDVRMIFGVPAYILALLRRIAVRRGLDDMRSLWPRLELIVTSGSGLESHREALEALCPGVTLLEMYLCTEAAVAFQPSPDDPGLMPMVEDVFLEFVPEARWGQADAPRLLLGEVEIGIRYVMLVTTPAGLYAYSPGDVVRFVSADPPRLVADGRETSVLNLATEKVNGPQAERALRESGMRVEGFTVCPAEGENVRHEWVIEFAGEPPPDAAARIDAAVRRLNTNYHVLRSGEGVLGPPCVTPVAAGTFEAALRRRAGQGKILRIYQDRKVRDELIALSAT
jgi:hypothetical protein